MTKINPRVHYLFLFLSLISFLFLFETLFHQNKYFLYWGLDGSYILDLAKRQFMPIQFRLGLENNLLQGIGNIWFPINYSILPGFIALNFSPEETAIENSYLIFAFEIFVATLISGRVFNLSWFCSIVAAWFLPFIAFPIFGLPLIYPIMSLVPSYASTILFTVLLIASFYSLGKRSIEHTTLMSAVCFLLIIYTLSSQPTSIILAAPTILIFCTFSLFNCNKPFELRAKLIASICIILALSFGPTQYVLGIFTYTAPYFFPMDFINFRANLQYASIAFHGKFNVFLFCTAALGVIIYIFTASKKNKVGALSLIFCMLLTLAFGLLSISTINWKGPSPIYFEFMLWPFYAVFSVELIKNLCLWCIRIFKVLFSKLSFPPIRFTYSYCLSLITLAPWLSILIPQVISNQVPAVYPPKSTKIIDYLKSEISLVPREHFRGRVATFTGLEDTAISKSWIDLHVLDSNLIEALGNDHRMVGLWFYNIPTLFEYSPLLSPAFHAFGKKYLALPQDGQIRNVITMRNIQTKYLQALGVRFVITDSPRNELISRVKMSVPNSGHLYLYELAKPNLGQYSPYQMHVSKSLNKTLEVMGQNNFDFNKDFVISDTVEAKLTPASNVSFYYGAGFIRIRASSSGTSLLALPLEYSHCLNLLQNDYLTDKPSIIRVNLLQSGLIFDKSLDVNLRYFTGPYQNSSCRLKDSQEFKKMLTNE